MNSRKLFAFGIGVLATICLAGGAQITSRYGSEIVAQIPFWSNAVLQSALPCHQIGIPERPICEGTPLNFLALLASVPLSVLVCSVLAYIWLLRRSRRQSASS